MKDYSETFKQAQAYQTLNDPRRIARTEIQTDISTKTSMSNTAPALRRSLGLIQVTLYGLGNILGAGIYVLIGEITGSAGVLAPFAFLLAASIAGLTAFSFAELCARYPTSGGGALYVHKGFRRPALTVVIGSLMMLTGIVSAATIARGFVGYLDVFIELPANFIIIFLIGALCMLACWGIDESVTTAAIITLVEIFGLLLIMAVAFMYSDGGNAADLPAVAEANVEAGLSGLIGASFLAFYAYIGFEDIVNVAEEVRSPKRTLPLAIAIALVSATVLYALATMAALNVLSPAELAGSEAPLADVYTRATQASPWLITLISLLAVINGALIQIIMCSRICFGLAQQQLVPGQLGRVNPKTQTPIFATVLISGLIVIAALSLSTEALARFTTTVLLIVFSVVNVSLIRIKQQQPKPDQSFQVPVFIPYLGLLTCLGFLVAEFLR